MHDEEIMWPNVNQMLTAVSLASRAVILKHVVLCTRALVALKCVNTKLTAGHQLLTLINVCNIKNVVWIITKIENLAMLALNPVSLTKQLMMLMDHQPTHPLLTILDLKCKMYKMCQSACISHCQNFIFLNTYVLPIVHECWNVFGKTTRLNCFVYTAHIANNIWICIL